VNVAVQCFDRLGCVLKQKVKTAIHQAVIEDPGDGCTQLPKSCWMNLVISKDGPYPFAIRTHLFMLVGLANLHAFVKAIALAQRVDLPDDPDFDPNVRMLDYKLEFAAKKHNNVHEKLKATIRESQLYQPFFEFFWSGFKSFSVKGAVNADLAQSLRTRVVKNKWKSPEEFIASLDQGREEGKAAFLKGDLTAAYNAWQGAQHLKDMTIHSRQGHNFMVNRLGTAYGAKFDEVMFHLSSNIAAVLLKIAAEPQKKHEEKMELAAKAHQACVFAIDCGQMRNFYPNNQQLGKVYFRKAQALRMRGCLRGNLKEAEKALAKARELCPRDPAIKAEKRELELASRSEMAKGNVQAFQERKHGSDCHCGC